MQGQGEPEEPLHAWEPGGSRESQCMEPKGEGTAWGTLQGAHRSPWLPPLAPPLAALYRGAMQRGHLGEPCMESQGGCTRRGPRGPVGAITLYSLLLPHALLASSKLCRMSRVSPLGPLVPWLFCVSCQDESFQDESRVSPLGPSLPLASCASRGVGLWPCQGKGW